MLLSDCAFITCDVRMKSTSTWSYHVTWISSNEASECKANDWIQVGFDMPSAVVLSDATDQHDVDIRDLVYCILGKHTSHATSSLPAVCQP